MHYDHRQPFAPGVRGLPMAKNETRSAIGVGGFHLDELALRLRQGVSARQKVAEDGLEMAVTQKTPRYEGPQRGFGCQKNRWARNRRTNAS